MKVVHLHRIAGIGGSERHLLALLPALAERGLDVGFVGLDDPSGAPDPFYEALEGLGMSYERLPSPRDLDPGLLRSVVSSLRRLRPDLVHTHLVHADLYGAAGATAAGAVLVSTKHNDDPFRAGRFRHVEQTVTRRTARVICITAALADFLADQVGLPREKLRIIHYGLDEPPAAWGDPEGPELTDDARLLLAVSRLTSQKGIDVAVRALAEIRSTEPEAVLVVLGDGPLRSDLEALVAELGLTEAVHLPGRVGDVTHWLGRADVFVHPARWEGFGLALLEAMLCARPIVASAVSSIPEIVLDGQTGLLVPPDDPAALAEATRTLLADGARADAMGEAGLLRAREEFSVERMAERTCAVYDEALASARR